MNPYGMRMGQGFGFPKLLRMSHRYIDYAITSNTAGTMANYLFRCNGMFDPNVSITGHQPMYYDNLTALYNHWFVFKSKLSLELLVDKDCNFVLYIDDDASTVSTITTAAEQPTAKSMVLSHLATTPKVVTMSWDAKSFFGGDVFDNVDLRGAPGSDPTEQSFYALMFIGANPADVVNLTFRAVIDYEVVWTEFRNETPS